MLDLGFLKNVNLGSRMRAQFRAEVYNALNRANLGGPNTTPTNSAFGTITAPERPAAAAAAGGEVELLGRRGRQTRAEGSGEGGRGGGAIEPTPNSTNAQGRLAEQLGERPGHASALVG